MRIGEVAPSTLLPRAAEAWARVAGHGWLFGLSLAWIGLIVVAAAAADLLPLPSPTDMDMLARRAPPSLEHWLGTDRLGRDLLARLIYGARISLTVAILAPLIALLIGGALGILAGYFRGRLETVVVGGVDVLLAFPPLVLALAVTAYLGQTVANLTYIIGVLSIPALPAWRGRQRSASPNASSSWRPGPWGRRSSGYSCANCCPTSS